MKKSYKYISIVLLIMLSGCSDIIDLQSESNIAEENFYSNYTEIQAGLTGCYKGLQKPLTTEWSLTELRSDNTINDTGSSNSVVNQDFSYLDQLYPATSHLGNYTYWLNTYNNIRNTNVVLNAVGAEYNEITGAIEYNPINTSIATATQCKSIAAEASFIRAYHYFNLVRLYGGVFLIHKAITPAESKTINRSSVNVIYKLIEADLKNADDNGSKATFAATPANLIGHANSWAAKALLAKVYLTLNRQAEAIVLLNSIRTSSGYGLESTYANVFSANNEMNKEILFTIRFKSGGVGLGNPLANLFAPSNSGNAIVNGDGKEYNLPSSELTSSSSKDASNALTWDPLEPRRSVNWQFYDKINSKKPYVSKFTTKSALEDDTENDFPVIRYADVLLMLAEAQGNNATSIGYINDVRRRAGSLTDLSTTLTTANFEKALSNERRWEFAFENQRFFDLVRFTTTTTTTATLPSKTIVTSKSYTTPAFTGKAEGAEFVMKRHFNAQFKIYAKFENTLPLTPIDLFENAKLDRFLLPIPQYEIDTNSNLVIEQNPSY
jgi:hypothetical protein